MSACPVCGLVGAHKLQCPECPSRRVELPVFVCPRCGAVSAHPDDVREGYCGHCHDWTAPR
jgi:ribosomal protein S27AE